MHTLADLKRAKTFKVKRIFRGVYHSGNHEQLIADYKTRIEELYGKEGLKEVTIVDGKSISFRSSTLLFPKQEQTTVGEIIIRSKDYIFKYVDDNGETRESFGENIMARDIRDYGFEIEAFGGMIEYHLLEDLKF